MDQNSIVGILIITLIALLILWWALRPSQRRYEATKEMKEEIKEKKIKAEVAERLAQKYAKKGRI